MVITYIARNGDKSIKCLGVKTQKIFLHNKEKKSVHRSPGANDDMYPQSTHDPNIFLKFFLKIFKNQDYIVL